MKVLRGRLALISLSVRSLAATLALGNVCSVNDDSQPCGKGSVCMPVDLSSFSLTASWGTCAKASRAPLRRQDAITSESATTTTSLPTEPTTETFEFPTSPPVDPTIGISELPTSTRDGSFELPAATTTAALTLDSPDTMSSIALTSTESHAAASTITTTSTTIPRTTSKPTTATHSESHTPTGPMRMPQASSDPLSPTPQPLSSVGFIALCACGGLILHLIAILVYFYTRPAYPEDSLFENEVRRRRPRTIRFDHDEERGDTTLWNTGARKYAVLHN
ncbi:hypothetical protein BC830DRAFT_1166515 [Chytriomyces sp. MP71]|nr:hypothetical protein BC830DRAFT_1166515 [Chytriomyces sp. MP71]